MQYSYSLRRPVVTSRILNELIRHRPFTLSSPTSAGILLFLPFRAEWQHHYISTDMMTEQYVVKSIDTLHVEIQ